MCDQSKYIRTFVSDLIFFSKVINYKLHTLPNGLRVAASRDRNSKLAAVNLLYCVGARNEHPDHTGFAHLFEHLMFRGTRRIPDFDTPVQMACGENNAFTNNDYTDFYITLPTANVETALWLESDRMTGLRLTPRKFEAEKRVVIEEYNQRYLNQPYGDQMMLARALHYRVHPYRWATIGLTPDHVAAATIAEAEAFYHRYYRPSNAILSIVGDLEEERAFELAEKWFGGIADEQFVADTLPVEPEQTEARRLEVERDVPATSITITFPMGDRHSRDYYLLDLVSDLLAGGESARLYDELVRRRRLFGAVNAYITGDVDAGMFVMTGQVAPNVALAEAEAALWDELHRLQNERVGDYELEKVRNKFEAGVLFGELNVMNKAMNLGYYSMLGTPELINGEVAIYRSISAEEIAEGCRRIFTPERSSTLIYRAANEKK